MRLDKWLSHVGIGSRKEVKAYLKAGQIHVNGKLEKDSGRQIKEDQDEIQYKGVTLTYQKFVYYMLNKPQGVITATEDPQHKTVLDLIKPQDQKQGLFPVGRLDKDTEGLLLLTNDGPLGHRLLSPKHHVAKTYEAIINEPIEEGMITAFQEGIELVGDGWTQPAQLKVLEENEHPRVEIIITEGKFHQIKRMFHAVGREVLYLKRTKMGPLLLDDNLPLGAYRSLDDKETKALLDLK